MRQRPLLFVLALAATAATAVTAQASAPVHAKGVVLSVSSEKHALRIVDGPRVFNASYRGTLPSGLNAGAQVTFSTVSQLSLRFVVVRHVASVVVSGTVVRYGTQLAVRVSDGGLIALPKGQTAKLGAVAKVTVRFTQPKAPTPAKTAKPPRAVGCTKADCKFDVTGIVTAVDASGAVTVAPPAGGAALTATSGKIRTANVLVGDFVHVAGTQAAATGVYTIVTLTELPGCDSADCTIVLDAAVVDIQATGFSVSDDQGTVYPFSATAALLATFHVDDSVQIVAIQDPTTGGYEAKTVTVLATSTTTDPLLQ